MAKKDAFTRNAIMLCYGTAAYGGVNWTKYHFTTSYMELVEWVNSFAPTPNSANSMHNVVNLMILQHDVIYS
jgi:hypothetical protein